MLHDPVTGGDPLAAGIARVVAVAAEYADAVDREGRFPHEAVQALREEGLFGAMVPVSLGGHGATLAELAGQTQQLARVCASTAMVYAMHHSQLACIVGHGLDQPWHRAFAERIASEQLLLASITSEVGIGGDTRSSLCAVEVADGRLTLVKQAPTVSYGAYADAFLVTARAHADAVASEQVMVTIPREQAEMEPTGSWDALGMRGTCSIGFTFRAEGVPEQVLPASFAEISAEVMVPVSHLLWSAAWTGIAVEALSRARQFLRAQARRSRGVVPPGAARLVRASGEIDGLRARLAPLIAQFDACSPLVDGAPAMSAEEAHWPTGMACGAALNMLKLDVSETCYDVVMEAMRICGMAGYKNGSEFSIGRHLRDIISAQLMINNDRIAATTGQLLLAQRTDLGTI
ncbi:acyl-CoA dehydrogenase [Sphingomonas insulae]|nr:acyl-CoA dehydrogenase [Sphingomonas insulae]